MDVVRPDEINPRPAQERASGLRMTNPISIDDNLNERVIQLAAIRDRSADSIMRDAIRTSSAKGRAKASSRMLKAPRRPTNEPAAI